ncbi:TetR family transcriptional regulator C-terminal domain-containing protein [Limibacter armeniacum]|uniref:TetR family transcriptional regulator C-terminal domain-containing protein n=1 Tax=Limibacter armeniacum TaxID=466084 RepID=UPI002FE5C6CA
MEKSEKTEKKIEKAYMRYVLTHNHPPASVFLFMDDMQEEEVTFYQHYASFRAIEQEIWGRIIEDTLEKVKNEEIYEQYSTREKLLSFYFTLIEELKKQRSFVVYSLKKGADRSFRTPETLKVFKEKFMSFANELSGLGITSGELVDRPFIGDRYPEAMWVQLLFVLKFWIEDDSKEFEQTDTAIEKAVHLSFDLISNNVFDSAVDFVKFLIQKK